MTCTKTGTAQEGHYVNVATVTAKGSISGMRVTDTDPSHYTVDVIRDDDAKISGHVYVIDNGKKKPLPGVTLVLFDDEGEEVARTTTDNNGMYMFIAPPGNYTIREIQPKDYYSVSEDEGGADDDAYNNVINTIDVVLDRNEHDILNDFVESSVTSPQCSICKPTICNTCATCGANIASDGSAILRWKPTNNESAYEIYLNGKYVTTVHKDVTSYTLKNLESDKNYEVKVVALGIKGGSTVQTIRFKTPPVDPAVLVPIYGLMLP
jgi:gamma-glutamylcyclotransferase (GGCT)/AIG2-like uncharacterized protein YtfP